MKANRRYIAIAVVVVSLLLIGVLVRWPRPRDAFPCRGYVWTGPDGGSEGIWVCSTSNLRRPINMRWRENGGSWQEIVRLKAGDSELVVVHLAYYPLDSTCKIHVSSGANRQTIDRSPKEPVAEFLPPRAEPELNTQPLTESSNLSNRHRLFITSYGYRTKTGRTEQGTVEMDVGYAD